MGSVVKKFSHSIDYGGIVILAEYRFGNTMTININGSERSYFIKDIQTKRQTSNQDAIQFMNKYLKLDYSLLSSLSFEIPYQDIDLNT